MGLDLALLPFESHPDTRSGFSHSIIQCMRRSELFEKIAALPSIGLDPTMPKKTPEDFAAEGKGKKPRSSETFHFTSYLATLQNGEHGYGETTHDPYGEPLRYVLAGELRKVAKHRGVSDNAKNRAVWAYLAELPEDTRVVLYWH